MQKVVGSSPIIRSSRTAAIAAAHGYPEQAIRGYLGTNFVRVLRRVEKEATSETTAG